MRIVVSPSEDGTREVTVYGRGAREKLAEFDVDEDEQAELRVVPVQHAEITPAHNPRDAGEVWAEVELDEYRVVGQ